MAKLHSYICAHGYAALAELEKLAAETSPQTGEGLAEIARHLVTLRDELIIAQRAGTPCVEWLKRTNAISSSIFGTEFPVNGFHWKCACETRDALRQTMSDLPGADAVQALPPSPSSFSEQLRPPHRRFHMPLAGMAPKSYFEPASSIA